MLHEFFMTKEESFVNTVWNGLTDSFTVDTDEFVCKLEKVCGSSSCICCVRFEEVLKANSEFLKPSKEGWRTVQICRKSRKLGEERGGERTSNGYARQGQNTVTLGYTIMVLFQLDQLSKDSNVISLDHLSNSQV